MTVVEFVAFASGGLVVELLGPRGAFAVAGIGALAAGALGAALLAHSGRRAGPAG